MREELSVGGPGRPQWMHGTHWDVSWGYPVNKTVYWRGREPATEKDIDLVRKHKGFDIDELSLCGILAREWDTVFFRHKYGDREELLSTRKLDDPWDTLPVPGGLGSWAYQSQNLPHGIDGCCEPRKWLWRLAADELSLGAPAEDTLNRSEGGEPFHYRHHRPDCPPHMGTAGLDQIFGGCPGTEAEGIITLEWDDDNQRFKAPD